MYKNPFALLKSSLNTILSHPVILYPFCIMAFIQLFILELLFFAPRYPLSVFFAPVIRRLAGEMYLHYPYNFMLLQQWFPRSWIQVPLYAIFYSFLLGVAVLFVNSINNHQKINLKEIYRQARASYVHLMAASLLVIGIIYGFSWSYGLLIKRALLIRSTTGNFFLIKQIVIEGTPFFNFLIGCVATTLFAFVVPVIMLENKGVFRAVLTNFSRFWKSFGMVFMVVFMTGLVYVPVILLRVYQQWYEALRIPELWGGVLVLGIAVMLFIDAVQVTAITTCYLLEKESEA